jgi:hypothetical protein
MSGFAAVMARDGTSWMHWNKLDGTTAVWHMNAGNTYQTSFGYGPYPGWISTDLSVAGERCLSVPPEADNNHSDDELAVCAYYPLLRLKTSPDLRRIYLLSLEYTQRVLRPEGSPFYNVLYGACTGRPCGAEAAAQWLRDAPLDLRDWAMRNSSRADVTLQPERDRFGEAQLTGALPPNETRVAKWNANPYQADAGGDGSREEDGTFWLLPYWMGRYHGIFGDG